MGQEGTRDSITVRLLYAIDRIADLEAKTAIRLFAIAAKDEDVAGEDVSGFAGFFNEDWREHDYRLGRRSTHEVLQRILSASYEREPTASYGNDSSWGDLAAVNIGHADKRKRKAFEDRLSSRAKIVVEESLKGGPWWIRFYPFRKALTRIVISLLRRFVFAKVLRL